MKGMGTFVDELDFLPAVPRHLVELILLLGQPDASLERVVEIIRYDPALAAQVIRLCNSARFGFETPVTDLEEAALRLGFDDILQLATALSAGSLLHPLRQGCASVAREVWQHSVASALVGKLIAQERSESPSLVFTVCLLHDVGKMVFYRNVDIDYGAIWAHAKEKQTSLRAAETAALGFDHAQIGGRLLEKWGFPGEFVEAVRCHHAPLQARENRPLAAYACLASQMAWFMDFRSGLAALDLSGRSEALELAGLEEEAMPHLMVRAYLMVREAAALVELPLTA